MKDKEQNHTHSSVIHFIKGRLNRPIALVGMMGAGKTQIGKALAEKLNMAFVDSDNEIESAAGCTVSDIFEYYGESAFRDVEKRVIKRLIEGNAGIIATGGGAIVNDESREIMLNGAIVIWLDADVETIYKRIASHTHRPLLQTEDPKARLKDLLDQRRDIYNTAHIRIDSQDVPLNKTLDGVLLALETYLAQHDNLDQTHNNQ